jgi:hypothetical protein
MNYLRLILVSLLCLLASLARAQDVEYLTNDDSGVLFENRLSEENSSTLLILDNTRTKMGRDFYESFYQKWAAVDTSLPRDTTAATKGITEAQALEDEFTIFIEEMPTMGQSTLLSIRLNDLLVWQDFLQPRIGSADEQAGFAVEVVFEYLLNYKSVQAQMVSEDEKGTGIF